MIHDPLLVLASLVGGTAQLKSVKERFPKGCCPIIPKSFSSLAKKRPTESRMLLFKQQASFASAKSHSLLHSNNLQRLLRGRRRNGREEGRHGVGRGCPGALVRRRHCRRLRARGGGHGGLADLEGPSVVGGEAPLGLALTLTLSCGSRTGSVGSEFNSFGYSTTNTDL